MNTEDVYLGDLDPMQCEWNGCAATVAAFYDVDMLWDHGWRFWKDYDEYGKVYRLLCPEHVAAMNS